MKTHFQHLLSLSLAAALSLSAWVPGASASAAVGTNLERLVAAAAEPGSERRQILDLRSKETTDYFRTHIVTADKKLTISANAPISIPEVDKIPLYSVSCQGFGQEQVSSIYRYLFEGEAAWYAADGQYYTKSMAEADIADAEAELERLESSLDLMRLASALKPEDSADDAALSTQQANAQIEACQNRITELNSIYPSLPEEIAKLPTDGTMLPETASTTSGEEECLRLEAHTDSGKALTVTDFGDRSAESILQYCSEDGKKFDLNSVSGQGINVLTFPDSFQGAYVDGSPERIFRNEVFRAYNGAYALACSFLEEAGIPYGTVLSADVLALESDAPDFALRFCYAREAAGMPAAATSSSARYADDGNPYWPYELLCVTVYKNAISNVYWYSPVTLGEQITEDADILPPEEAIRIFKETARIVYGSEIAALEQESGCPYRLTVSVNKLSLSMIRLRDGGKQSGLYVPAWVFYGERALQSGDSSPAAVTQSPWIVYAVNAIDGSIIDIKAGY